MGYSITVLAGSLVQHESVVLDGAIVNDNKTHKIKENGKTQYHKNTLVFIRDPVL